MGGQVKARDAVGKKIVAVRQTRWFNEHTGTREVTVDALILEDGTELRPHGFPTETDIASTILVSKKKKS